MCFSCALPTTWTSLLAVTSSCVYGAQQVLPDAFVQLEHCFLQDVQRLSVRSMYNINLFFGDMTLVTYLRKSFSFREDDSAHSPHYINTRGMVWGFLFTHFSLELFRELFREGKKQGVYLGEEAFQLFIITPIFLFVVFPTPPFLESAECVHLALWMQTYEAVRVRFVWI